MPLAAPFEAAILPTSALAPPGARTIVLNVVSAPVLPAMSNTGSTLYGVDFAQIAVPGDPGIQVDPFVSPAGLLANCEASCDQATALVTVNQALAAGVCTLSLVMTFASGAQIRSDVALPVTPLPPLPVQPSDVLALNGFPLTFGGIALQVGTP